MLNILMDQPLHPELLHPVENSPLQSIRNSIFILGSHAKWQIRYWLASVVVMLVAYNTVAVPPAIGVYAWTFFLSVHHYLHRQPPVFL